MSPDPSIILAETANQLYRDSDYKDLISFEEDIARLSAYVVVIAESYGSLAELGAFASRDAIRESLLLIINSEFSETESFVRSGPIQRVLNDDQERVGFFPWSERKNGSLVKGTASRIYVDIASFVKLNLKKINKTELLHINENIGDFILTYWVVYLSVAPTKTMIQEMLAEIGVELSTSDLTIKLYCMRLAGWIGAKDIRAKFIIMCCTIKTLWSTRS